MQKILEIEKKVNLILEQIQILIDEGVREYNLDELVKLRKFIILHLVKIIRYKDDINYNKHITDIDDMVEDCMRSLKWRDTPRLKLQDIEKFIFVEFYSNIEIFKKLVNRLDKKYNKLPIINNDVEDIYNKIKHIVKLLSKDIFTKRFDTIEDYF
ncbi:MAG: hypothetical protein H7836_08180 [Magnetococcus sp. YQC-3]